MSQETYDTRVQCPGGQFKGGSCDTMTTACAYISTCHSRSNYIIITSDHEKCLFAVVLFSFLMIFIKINHEIVHFPIVHVVTAFCK